MNNEVKSLTGLRGAAALIVMLYHFSDGDAYFQSYVPSLIERGYLFVDVFFVLSGFVMALSYSRYFKDGITISDYKSFMVKRLARIYPLYIFLTLVFQLKYELKYLGGSWERDAHTTDFIASVLMVQAWGFGFSYVAGTTWSLSTELFAYIIFPFVVSFAVFARPAYALGVFALSVVLLLIVVTSHQGVGGSMNVVASSSIMPVLRCLAGFFLGLICYRFSQMNTCRKFFTPSAALLVVMIGLLLAAHFEAHDLILFAFFPPIVLMLYFEPALARLVFANRVSHHLGVVSYSMYLVHPLFSARRLEPIAERYMGNIAHPLTLIALSLLTWGGACVLYRWVEKPGRLYVQRISLLRKSSAAIFASLPPLGHRGRQLSIKVHKGVAICAVTSAALWAGIIVAIRAL
jgi:peptidoglycan/LPS O-acetylase OafA/YrhL